MNENQNIEKINQANSEAAAQMEPKTVINGKVVSLQQAQMAEEAFNQTMSQSGIQAHHSNASEAVNAGDVAKSASTAEASAAQVYNQAAVKQADVQSGQAHLESHMPTAEQAAQKAAQAAAQAAQQNQVQSAQQSAAEAQAEQAAEAQKAAAEVKARATKKGQ